MEAPQPPSPPTQPAPSTQPTHDPPPTPVHPLPSTPEPAPQPQPSPGQPEPGPARDPPLYPEHDRASTDPIPGPWTPDLPIDEVVFDEDRVPG